jgi:hypothetical protein
MGQAMGVEGKFNEGKRSVKVALELNYETNRNKYFYDDNMVRTVY